MVSVWVSVALVAFIVIIGIGVDFAGHAGASQDASAVADEAARAGGQHLDLETAAGHVIDFFREILCVLVKNVLGRPGALKAPRCRLGRADHGHRHCGSSHCGTFE